MLAAVESQIGNLQHPWGQLSHTAPHALQRAQTKACRYADASLIDGERAVGNGLAELASAVNAGTPHRSSGRVALHVLEAMYGILDAAASSRCRRKGGTAVIQANAGGALWPSSVRR